MDVPLIQSCLAKTENQKAQHEAGLFSSKYDGDERLPSEVVGFRSARARCHACRHAGGGQKVGVGEGLVHWAGIVARVPARSKINGW